MKKRYNFTIEEKLMEQVNAIVEASQKAGFAISKSAFVETALLQMVKNIVKNCSEEVKDKKEEA